MALKALHKQEARIKHNKKLVMTISWCKACGICMALCPQDVLGTLAVVTGAVKPQSIASAIPLRLSKRQLAAALAALAVGVKLAEAMKVSLNC
jgi:MinD superfamily P-loop ATPase